MWILISWKVFEPGNVHPRWPASTSAVIYTAIYITPMQQGPSWDLNICSGPQVGQEEKRIASPAKRHYSRTYSQKVGKTKCSNYRGIALLSISNKILTSILLYRLIPYADEIIGDYQCRFRSNRSMTDHIFYIPQTWRKSGSIMVQYISYL
jgi:hypothetical protein